MRHRASRRFWERYYELPEEIQELADRCFELLRQNPHHPSLHFGRVDRFWSARVGLHYRALGFERAEGSVWWWIGSHAFGARRQPIREIVEVLS